MTTVDEARLREHATLAAGAAAQLSYERWFFGEALAMDGLLLAAEAFADASMAAIARGVVDPWVIDLSRRAPCESDLDAPIRALLALARAQDQDGGGDLDYVGAARKAADHLIAQPTAGGAMLHALRGYDHPMVFVDCIYYAGPYLSLLAAVCGPEYMDAAARQTAAHVTLLRTSGSDLFHHCFDPERNATNGIAWGRGNGWAMLGLVDTLELIPSEHPSRSVLERACAAQIRACAELQDASGHWHTILDDPQSPLEPSIAGFMVAALAKAHAIGLVGDAVGETIARAWHATCAALQPDGRFPTSMTEWPAWEADAYYARPSGVNPWGQGVYLRAAVQMRQAAGISSGAGMHNTSSGGNR